MSITEVQYIGKTPFPEASMSNGYWVKGSKVYDVTASAHVKFMLDNLELFDLTKEDIATAYAEFKEKPGIEGKAREALIKYVSSYGWVRVRHYRRPEDYWSIQADNTKIRKETITDFIYWAIKNKVMAYDDSVIILGYDNEDDREVYTFQTGGVKNYLMAENKNKKPPEYWKMIWVWGQK